MPVSTLAPVLLSPRSLSFVPLSPMHSSSNGKDVSLIASRSPGLQFRTVLPLSVNPHIEMFKFDDSSKVFNPESKRWIARGGNVYKSLVKRGVIIVS